ncbi:unnamed protein product [marine sediment metagenome]|uniref:Uncharacterized protein n=1 Tax=marine sediment metagenome TaxID=412755 RepID=X1DPC6_9ZZZZ
MTNEEEKIIKGVVQKQLDVIGAEHIQVRISEDGKTLWVNNEFVCLLRVCRIKNLHLQDDRRIRG